MKRKPWELFSEALRRALFLAGAVALVTALWAAVAVEDAELVVQTWREGSDTDRLVEQSISSATAGIGISLLLCIPIIAYVSIFAGYVGSRRWPYVVMSAMQLFIISLVAFGVV